MLPALFKLLRLVTQAKSSASAKAPKLQLCKSDTATKTIETRPALTPRPDLDKMAQKSGRTHLLAVAAFLTLFDIICHVFWLSTNLTQPKNSFT